MKKRLLLFALLLAGSAVQAQKKAVTEAGEEVILFEDGTWKYEDVVKSVSSEIPINPKNYVKSASAGFLLKSTKMGLGFWMDPKKWSFKKAVNNDDAEYELQFKNGDLYGMIITEKIEIPLETMKEIAVANARNVSPDIRITKEEYRTVNGNKVLNLRMDGTMKGIKFTYFGYYYSNAEGTVQFITYTSQNLLDKYKESIEELLNGLVEIKPE